MRIIFCHPEHSRGISIALKKILRLPPQQVRGSLRMTIILLCALCVCSIASGCAYKGPLKSPSQIQAEEAKRAQKGNKAAAPAQPPAE